MVAVIGPGPIAARFAAARLAAGFFIETCLIGEGVRGAELIEDWENERGVCAARLRAPPGGLRERRPMGEPDCTISARSEGGRKGKEGKGWLARRL